MLCKLLGATEAAGNPGSHFHEPSIEAWLGYYDLKGGSFSSKQDALKAIFAAAAKVGKSESDIFGLRLQRDSFQFFADQLKVLHPNEATDFERIEAAFGVTLFIYLRREDHLGQAISRLRAEQTGLWHRKADGSDLERNAPTREAGYDHDTIQSYVQEAIEQNEQWARWFAEQSIMPLKISYEELSRRPQAVLTQILTSLDVDASLAETVPVQTAKLADETNTAWRSRFEVESKGAL
jgi:LPS sulfotransferase NodH